LKSFAPGLFFFGIYCLLFYLILSLVVNVFWTVWLPATLMIAQSSLMFFGLYYMILGAESVRLVFKQRRPDIVLLLPAVFSLIHINYGWGILREFFFPNTSRQ